MNTGGPAFRVCPRCEVVFQINLSRKRHVYCRPCESARSVEHARKYPERKRILNKKYLHSEKGKAAIFRKTTTERLRYPEKYKARMAVQTALRNGRLSKQPCEICSEIRSVAHHDDYAKPLSVRWLCTPHHLETHSAMLTQRKQP